MLKKILIAVLIIAAIGGIAAYRMWTKPHEKAEDIKGIAITATALAQAYKADEKAADARYLNKVIEVTGAVNEVDKNQDGGTMIVLESGDPMTGIQCAMRDKGVTAQKGDNKTIKGFCSGSGITGIALTGCVIK